MKQEIAKEWIDRLRSGKYKQGKRYLERNGQYCCLGVLCEIAAENGIVKKEDGFNGYVHLLPPEVMAWADVKCNNGLYGNSDENLALLNDQGFSFCEIANVIEKNVNLL